MDKIPQKLVKSLMELGLLESEAKIYIALTIMDHAEVKELINILGLSKPNIYEGLRMLEEKGLVVLINTRPMAYQAIPPEIGLEMLLKTHLDAKKEAKKIFSTLDKEEFVEKSSEALFQVYGEKSIDYKIKDMLNSATESVFMISSFQYLKYIKNLSKNLKFDITIFSEGNPTEQEINEFFANYEGNFQIISEKNAINMYSSKITNPEEFKEYKEALSMFEYRNMMVLMIDDSEIMYVLPFSQDTLSAFNTKNKSLITLMKLGLKNISHQLAEN
ncbi:MAG: HTH-type transcriptional regulator, sugar sensing transcriptional regulator [Methanobacterium sp.]|uniref:TrmB family transcriptional regulator n=1 Tax=Methanobacterium sp. TaxID=2164 RepID=UPI0024AAAD37|nr:helix-turn-helix domain-containing protein [Methanobacterium sp.]MDI3550282.1 HTH-type transcriptional regulator, sugar sensing transcriptional regulator [Methanobacterium sp.]